MARTTDRRQPEPAQLTPAQMLEAIPKIERRITEVEAFDPNSVSDRSDPRISVLEKRLESLLISVFGIGTVEYNRYLRQITSLDRARINLNGTPMHEVVEGLHKGKAAILVHLHEIIGIFREELEDRGPHQ